MDKKLWDKKLWKDEPDDHDYPAAYDYLELLYSPKKCRKVVSDLKRAKMKQKKAKDILRASGLPLLPKTNVHVAANIKKTNAGEKLSPILLVNIDGKLIVADGYHRICAIYYLSEDFIVPCKLV